MRWSFIVSVLCGCHSPQPPVVQAPEYRSVNQLTKTDDYAHYVGKRVEVVGEVSNTKLPQVSGIRAWSLEEHRGRRVKIRGVLRETVVTEEEVRKMIRAGLPGTSVGRFYSLENMECELLPDS